ncbi:hypothetical protein [Brucella sp. 63/311]|uniref:hypothetical protein n=1 Tax=Brucella sp. 63/311 TaxID=1160235 RepID=UPI0009D9EA4E|nr:hypothetical protein [Brucella sp. 63/311]
MSTGTQINCSLQPGITKNATVVLTGLPKHSQRKRTSWRNGACSGCFLNRKFAHELPVTFYHDFAHYGGASK